MFVNLCQRFAHAEFLDINRERSGQSRISATTDPRGYRFACANLPALPSGMDLPSSRPLSLLIVAPAQIAFLAVHCKAALQESYCRVACNRAIGVFDVVNEGLSLNAQHSFDAGRQLRQ